MMSRPPRNRLGVAGPDPPSTPADRHDVVDARKDARWGVRLMSDLGSYRAALERALRHTLSHLDSLREAPVAATATAEELRARLARPLADEGCDAARVIDDLVADCAGGIIGSAGGRFFG